MRRVRKAWSLDLRSQGARAKRLTNNIRNFELLIGDLESMPELMQGQVRLYTVTGDPDDPEARFTGNIPTNFPLVASLQTAYDSKTITVDDDILGFGMAGVAVRHLTFQEYMDRDPDMFQRVLKQAKVDNADLAAKNQKKFEQKAIALMERYYEAQVLPNLPPPPMMPDNMRVRAVVVSVLMKDGLSFVMHSHPAHKKGLGVEAIDKDTVTSNKDFNALFQYLHGVRPELVADPYERVAEFALLKSAWEGVTEESE